MPGGRLRQRTPETPGKHAGVSTHRSEDWSQDTRFRDAARGCGVVHQRMGMEVTDNEVVD